MKRKITLLIVTVLFFGFSSKAQQLDGTYWDGYTPGPPPQFVFTLGFVDDTVFVLQSGQSFPISTYTESGNTFVITDIPGGTTCVAAGEYTFVISNDTLSFTNVNDNCLDRVETIEGFIWVRQGIDINEMYLNNAISFYPNPARDVLTIEFSEDLDGKSYSIQNAIGQQMRNRKIETFEERLDVSDLPSGLYFIAIEGQTTTHLKFIKQ